MITINLFKVIFISPVVFLASCGDMPKMRSSEMIKESPYIVAWAEKTHADIIAILPIKPPSKFSHEESAAVKKFVDTYPNSFSLAKEALSKKSDDLWQDVILNGKNSIPTSFVPLAESDANSLSQIVRMTKPIKAWIIMLKRSNNYFGDSDTFLTIISLDGHPLAYGYFGVNAGVPDNMCKVGVYVPYDSFFPNPNPVKKLDDLPAP